MQMKDAHDSKDNRNRSQKLLQKYYNPCTDS